VRAVFNSGVKAKNKAQAWKRATQILEQSGKFNFDTDNVNILFLQ
jgi:hypothetical protein